NAPVMQFVPRNDERQGASADRIIVSSAQARGSICIKMPEERQCCLPDRGELFDQIGQHALAEVAVANVVVLLETFDGGLVTARDAQGAIGHDALAVVQMAQDFLYAPLVRSIAEVSLS